MQAVTSTATRVLKAILDQQPLTPAKVTFAWRLSVGPTLAAATSISWSTDGDLRVRVKNEHWRQELVRMRPILVDRLRDLLGREAVRTLRVSVS